MNETLDCTNCCISDFKHSLCDCHGDFCTKYKSIGDENDFMQAVLADRPSGEWIYKDDSIFAGKYYCDNCDSQAEVDLYGEWILSDYCPNCGAYMRGKDDE